MKPTDFPYGNLQEMIDVVGNPVHALRNSPMGPFPFPVVAPEYSNWRDEQRAWRESVAILNLSHHETDLFVSGPDAVKLFSHIGINNFRDFPINRAKQLCCCSPDGYVITDGFLFHYDDDVYRVAGFPPVVNYVQYHAETGGYDVTYRREENSLLREGPPSFFMYQVQGPKALALMDKATNGNLPEIKFFHIGNLTINGIPVRALRHGMAGTPGFEMTGDWQHAEEVMEALYEAGKGMGVRKVGSRAYPTTSVESAWFAHPLPAIYEQPELRGYREWLSTMNLEVIGSLGGSFVSEDIKDYYVRPEELGYERFVDFDHDFIGKEALRETIEHPTRKKVTLLWNDEDAAEIIASSLLQREDNAKYLDLPCGMYSVFHFDSVLKDDEHVGVSQYMIHSANAGKFMSLAVVDTRFSEPGTALTLLWGEPGSDRPPVEPHTMRRIRTVVAAAPYYEKTIARD